MLTVDNSMLADYRLCERLFKLRYIDGYMQGDSVHLHAGSALAHAIETVRVRYFDNGFNEDDAIQEGQATLIQDWGNPLLYAGEGKNLRSVTRALHQYFEDFPVATHWPIHRFQDGKLAVECHFEIPFGEDIYCGTPDAIVEYGGGLWLCDEKTTGSYLDDKWSSQWKRRAQFSGYVFALRHQGIKIDGVLVRGIQIQKTQCKTKEYASPRHEWQVSEWEQQTARDIARIKESVSTGIWGCTFDDGCVKFGRECDFMSQCNSPSPDYSKFKRGTWVPEKREWVINV